jgi:NADH-quinone oxidoreductase subunit F
MIMSLDEIRAQAVVEWEALEHCAKPRIIIGFGTCGQAAGANAVLQAINNWLVYHKIDAVIMKVGCIGLCYAEPLIDIVKPRYPRICYSNVTPEKISEIMHDYLMKGNPRPDFALGTLGKGTVAGIPKLFDLPMLKPQVRIVLRNCGIIDPENINHYIAFDGYKGISRALSMSPDDVIGEIKKSGLRGRGGAGFPAGTKWKLCRKSIADKKYIICNADEGDPGAFMNRSLLEGDPHSVLEGMLIGAYAMGATEGYIYIRAEYPLAIVRLKHALSQMEKYNLLGNNILGSDFSFRLHIKEGAGAFVCGEETALMASIEGKRGMPRSRPPFPAQSGLWGKPTNINNVESWACAAVILQRGADWFASYGSEKSKGTKTFALVGKIKRTGLIEVPLGIPLYDIIYNIGGGIVNNRRFKAVQTGGPSGGCIPVSLLNIPVDYESLAQAGAIVGSGGMVVMDEDTCMVDVARYFLRFIQSESCGKCVMCRLGTKQMLDILERICNGNGKPEDIDLLYNLSLQVKAGSLCGLGQTAPNPVLTTLRYFRNEYEDHIKKLHCVAAVCPGLVSAPCSHTCPANIDVPRYVRFIAAGKPDAALAVIREKIPFPAVCGRVCFHTCEDKCRRGQIDESIAIRILKRFASDNDNGLWKQNLKIAEPTGKRVAIIGSGPAGLTAAYYLAKSGHSVTVFEALPEPGGMMRFGIPNYRLPKNVLKNEIQEIANLGVEIRTNSRIVSPESLLRDNYASVFIATGAHQGMKLGIAGETNPGVSDCITFLRDVSLGKPVRIGKRVAVIGGGNAAIDSARTALRLGAKEVRIHYRRTRDEMPANPEETEQALAEGIQIQYLIAPVQINLQNNILELECVRMKLGMADYSGRRRPKPIKGSEFKTKYDNIIVAIGHTPEIPEEFGLPIDKGNIIKVNPDSLATGKKGIFAGGDAVTGPASVIEAIAAGRLAAVSIDKYLGGSGVIDETLAPPEKELPPLEEAEEKRRPKMRMLSIFRRINSFDEVELGFTKRKAREEAMRCLRCDKEKRD